jgi:lipopolysaccharide export system permease protein
LTILQKYLFREWALTFGAVSIVLMIVLMGVFLGELLNDMADGKVPAGLVGMQLLLHLPDAMGNILPLSGFIAVVWGLGRLYRDQEMAVMRSNGFGWRQMLRPLANLVVPVAGLLLVLSMVLAPRASRQAERLLEEGFRSAALWGVKAGQFHILQEGQMVIYVESLDSDGRTLRNVFIQQRDPAEREKVWIAQRGEYWMDAETGQRYLTLEDGQIVDNVPGQLDARLLDFERNDFRLPEPEQKRRKEGVETQASLPLLRRGDTEAIAEMQWRVAPAVSVLLLGLLAIPLSHSEPREGRGSRIVIGILCYALYANMLYLSRAWLAQGSLPPAIGLWWAHALILVSALILLRRQGRMPGRG